MKEKIKIWLNANWFKIGLLVLLAIIIGGVFYWYSLRLSIIKKECEEYAITFPVMPGQNPVDEYNLQYQMCLRRKGL